MSHHLTSPILYKSFSKIARSVRRRGTPLSIGQVRAALAGFGTPDAPALMVHSSLSGCGLIAGGPRTVVDCLREWIGPATLVMPAHSYCYPQGDKPAPVFNVDTTPSAVGAITNYFRRQPGTLRSVHPSHSVCCDGPLAAELCRDHEWSEKPCGPGTPYTRLLDLECAVLMFGATLNGYTFFHTAEDAAQCPYLYMPQRFELFYADRNGLLWSFESRRQDIRVTRRFEAMHGWLEERALLRRCALGYGELLYIPNAAKAHRALVDALRIDPWLLVDEAERSRRGV